MRRYLAFATVVVLLAIGLGVGGAVGYREGCLAGRLAVADEYTDMSVILNTIREQAASRVEVGMTKPEAEAIVTREGYKPDKEGRDKDLWRWSKPWRRGLQYVNIRFDEDRVIDVSNLWIDS